MSKRRYLHKYKILTGEHAGETHLGYQIGEQEYLDQITLEDLTYPDIISLRDRQYALNRCNGIWLIEPEVAVYCPVPVPGKPPKVEITTEGVNYDDVYMDLCVPYDRFNNEIQVGDQIYVASSNEVRLVRVERIANKPFHASYGIMNRKLTVHDGYEPQTLTINNPRATVKP